MKKSLEKFSFLQKQAEKLAGKQKKLDNLLKKAAQKANKENYTFKKIWQEITLLIQLVKAYISGQYRNVPWKVIIMAIAALIYFVNPFDVVPDLLTGIGLLDDATVIAFVMNAIRDDIECFKKHRSIAIQ